MHTNKGSPAAHDLWCSIRLRLGPAYARLAQGLACLSVAWAALHSARESTTPALHLEHSLFPASNTLAASASSQAGMDGLPGHRRTGPGLDRSDRAA